jgi:hypothetical protein
MAAKGQSRKWRAIRGESALPPMNGHHQTGPAGPFRANSSHLGNKSRLFDDNEVRCYD